MPGETHNVIVIGSGPAGLTAAIYAARANLAPMVFEGFAAGGQLMNTTDVENYPGFADGIQGPELMTQLRGQAERFGATLEQVDVTRVDFSERPFRVWVAEDEHRADAVIVATGATPRWLGLPGEARLKGFGVSSCATCDGFFFRDREMVVVGGGDSAMEEALYLSRIASKVTIVHRRDEFRASKIMADRALANEKIEVRWNAVVDDVLGEDKVTGVRVRDVDTDELSEIPAAAMFVAIGHIPTSALFADQLALDDEGYIVGDGSRTSIEGVFVAGDVKDKIYRQAITAAGSGCMAAIDAERWLEETRAETAPSGDAATAV